MDYHLVVFSSRSLHLFKTNAWLSIIFLRISLLDELRVFKISFNSCCFIANLTAKLSLWSPHWNLGKSVVPRFIFNSFRGCPFVGSKSLSKSNSICSTVWLFNCSLIAIFIPKFNEFISIWSCSISVFTASTPFSVWSLFETSPE